MKKQRRKVESEEWKYNCAKVRRNVRKVAKCCVFPLICGSAGSKSRLAKAAGAEVAAHTLRSSDVENWHAAVARSTFPSQMLKNWRSSRTFGSSDVEKWHAAVARSKLASQNVKNLRGTDHFLTLGCVKLVENSTPLWRQAHLQVKMLKKLAFCSTFRGFTGQVN